MFVLKIIFAIMVTVPFGFVGYILYTNLLSEGRRKGQ